MQLDLVSLLGSGYCGIEISRFARVAVPCRIAKG
jgi:hypothetical protein